MKEQPKKSLFLIIWAVMEAFALYALIDAFRLLPTAGEYAPLYLKPWGGALVVKDFTLYNWIRLPLIGFMLLLLVPGLEPDEAKGWTDSALYFLRRFLLGIALVCVSQLSLAPFLTYRGAAALPMGIALIGTLLAGAALAVFAYLSLVRELRPLCSKDKTPFSVMIDTIFTFQNKKRRNFLVAVTAVFLLTLVIPALSL